MPALSETSKYQRWYEAICAKGRNRDIPTAYTEVHHIKPRSLGGSDDESNLVRLTYREHFIAHWLLTKFHDGGALCKMQRALWAMTLKSSGERVTSGWQFAAAKRAVRDMELSESIDVAWRERRAQKQVDDAAIIAASYKEYAKEIAAQEVAEAVYLLALGIENRDAFLAKIAKQKPEMAAEVSRRIAEGWKPSPRDRFGPPGFRRTWSSSQALADAAKKKRLVAKV